MQRKVIFLDIDGTLTVMGSNIPPDSAIQAIRGARAAGHLVFLCTGRNYAMLKPLLRYGFDGVVASAGGYICCGKKVIYDCPMTGSQQQLVLDTLKENGIFRTVECLDGSYTDDEFKELFSGIVNGELINRKFHKGKGVEKVCRYLQIPLEDSVAFGDSMNDMEMMETAGYSVCMENGSEILKKLADEVCPRVEQDGLFHAFSKLGLIK